MASWFRAAEELFEVVDRRAKQVTDEILVGQNPATEFGVLGRVLATSPLTKGPNAAGKVTAVANTSTSHSNGFKNEIVSPGSLSIASGSIVALPDATQGSTPNVELDSEPQQREHLELTETERPLSTVKAELPDISIEGGNVNKKDGEADNVNPTEASPSLNNVVVDEDVQESPLEHHESVKCKFGENNSMVTVQLVAEKASEHAKVGMQPTNDPVENRGEFLDILADNPTSSVLEQDSSDSKIKDSTKVEEQLDEAQGLLKIAVSSGQSKEARLARVCAGLSSRLQEYKTENAQLEALLQKERHEKSLFEMQLAQMQSEVVSARAASSSVEAEMSAALASKNAEIEALVSSLENIKKQAALSEGKLAAVQANMEVMARSRDLTENGMIQTLTEALEAAEHRAEEEHAAHVATRKAAAKRETELEQCVADVTAALTRMQRTLDERTQKATDLEYKVSTLEIDCANMNQELQQMEAKLRREQKRAPEEALQLQAWREDADRAREAHREAEGKILALEAENQKLRVELAGVKRETDQVSTQAHLELEKRFRDLTEVLYLKQTQLEAMASEKAAAVFQLEKELSKSREAQAEVERHKRIRHSVSGWDDGHEMKTLESLGLQQRPLVGSSIQRAAKLLDSGAVTAGRFLWRRPLARLGVLFYLVFVHVFLLYLLHRLQEQAANFMSSKEEMEAAAAAGLLKLGMQR